MTVQTFTYIARAYRSVDAPVLFGECVGEWRVEQDAPSASEAFDLAWDAMRNEIETVYSPTDLPSYRLSLLAS